ncbi:MAG: FHA domain-containing protein [Fimbriimonadaceae bacterium]|nr:FHA domain-containing protein [Fimbriimonadaceae bacterium]
MHRFLTCLILAIVSLLAASAWAQDGGRKLPVQLPSDGSWTFWLREPGDPGRLQDPLDATGSEAEVTVRPGLILGVADRESNRAAEIPVDEALKTGSWKPTAGSFNRVAELTVKVIHDLKPVASASVEVKVGPDRRTALISPSDQGTIVFRNLAKGEATVSVSYPFGGETKTASPVKISLTPGEEARVSFDLQDKVDTVTPEAPPAESASATPPADGETPVPGRPGAPQERSIWGNLLGFLLGLAVLAGIGYGLYAYFKKSPDQVKDLMKQAGLNPDDNPGDPPAAPTVAKPEPIKQIVLDDAAPTPIGAPMAAPVSAPAGPALIASDGSRRELSPGSLVLGRGDDADWTVSGEGISRRHAELRVESGRITVSDLGSTNGTWVNGRRIDAETVLQPGDLLTLGSLSWRVGG